jgi:ubiquinol-cytochrome c reductase cytochrome b subunit
LQWLEGALVLYPAWEVFPIPGVVISPSFVAGILLPGVIFALLFAYPWIDRRIAPHEGEAHVLHHPFDVPARAGIVAAGVAVVVTLTVGSHVDSLSLLLGVRAEALVVFFQVAVLAAPVLVFLLVWSRARTFNRQAPGRPGVRR